MKSKLMSLDEASSLIASGSSISVGGFTSQRPTALLRTIIRNGVRDLVVYCRSAGSDVDLLIGAGSVKRVEGAYLADGVLAPIASIWRRFVEAMSATLYGRCERELY